MKVSIKCFGCDGKGKRYIEQISILAHSKFYTIDRGRLVKCTDCNGTGRLSVARYNSLTDYSKLPF